MKRFFFVLAASTFLLAACSGLEQSIPEIMDPNDSNVGEGDLVEKVVFEVLPIKDGDEPETKASAVPYQNPNGGQSVKFVWEATDTVGIYPNTGSQVYFNIEGGVGTSSVSFNGGGWALKSNSTYYSYYPFVGDIYLKRNEIPVSFAGQKQIGITAPFTGARYFLATDESTSVNGVLTFTYNTLNTIINVNATLPAGTYTKASLTISEPLFVEEGTYNLEDRVIIGTKMSNTLEMNLEGFTLTEQSTVPIYFMSAPVDLRNKEIIVRIISDDGKRYKCSKTPLNSAYSAGMRYGLNCLMEEERNVIYYTSRSGNTITPSPDPGIGFGANMVSNDYIDGQGIIIFDGDVTRIVGFNYTDLTSIVIPSSVTEIPAGALSQCYLTSIKIPSSVTRIHPYAFRFDYDLTSIVVDPCNSKYDSRDNCNAIIETGTNTLIYGCKTTTIPNTVTSIGNYAFDGCSGLTSIIIPDSVTSIGYRAFVGCSMTSVNIPNSVLSFGNEAFAICRNLASFDIPDSVTSIGESVFQTCTSLTSINIPNSVISIGKQALCYCTSLTTINIPESVTSIGEGAFALCTSLTTINIPESVTSIGEGVFEGCTSLTTINIPESVTSIGNQAFQCTGLTSISIPNSVTSIGEWAFEGCSSLTTINIPNSVTRIERNTFGNCTNLTSITLSENVSYIGDEAFVYCTHLPSIMLPETVSYIGEKAFYMCNDLTFIAIKASTPPILGWILSEDSLNNCLIYVPAESVETYKNAWRAYADRIRSMEGGDVPPSGDGGDE